MFPATRREGATIVDDAATTPEEGSRVPGGRIEAVDGRTFTEMMEQLQEGYVASIAATAGCAVEPIRRDIYGFDVRLIRPTPPGVEEITLMAQLKNTTAVKPDTAKNFFSYQLKKREYLEDLAAPRTGVKAILLVSSSGRAAEHYLIQSVVCYIHCAEL
jgi:hypothetical protein